MPKAQRVTSRPQVSNAPDYVQLSTMSIDQVRAEIVKIGADYNVAEKKPDLMARLLQLQGTAQPIDKIKRELQAHGIGDDAKTDAVPTLGKRLTPEQLRKIAIPFVAKGMKLLISKDGQLWEIRFQCEQPKQGGGTVMAKRKDSGNTMIPANVFKSACDTLTTYSKIKRNIDGDVIPEDYDEVADNEAA